MAPFTLCRLPKNSEDAFGGGVLRSKRPCRRATTLQVVDDLYFCCLPKGIMWSFQRCHQMLTSRSNAYTTPNESSEVRAYLNATGSTPQLPSSDGGAGWEVREKTQNHWWRNPRSDVYFEGGALTRFLRFGVCLWLIAGSSVVLVSFIWWRKIFSFAQMAFV